MTIEVRDNIPAAFPTIGKRMRPTNPLLIWPLEVRPSIESTRNSAVTATSYAARSDFATVREMNYRQTTVTTARSEIVICRHISGPSASSSGPASNDASC